MKSRDYELLVQEIFRQFLNQSSVPNILIEHDVIKKGVETTHQIDVYWEFKLGDITYRTVVQAKNWAKPVDKGELLKFESVLRDLPGQPRGIVVAAKGYQKGALEVARARGIRIYELTQAAPSPHIVLNYTGWIRYAIKGYRQAISGQPFGLVIETEVVNPEFSDLLFQADSAWVQDNGGTLPSTSHLKVHSHEIEFYDAEQRFLRTLQDIYKNLAKEVSERGETRANQTYSFENPTFLKVPSTSSLVKILSFSVEVTLKTEREEKLRPLGNVAMFVLNSLDDDKSWQVAYELSS